MKNSLLLGYLLLTSLGVILALDFNSFHPTKAIEMGGNVAGDSFGYSVSSAGDIDNDGYDDILIGAYGKDSEKGAAYVIYGADESNKPDIIYLVANDALNASITGFKVTGSTVGDQAGWSVSSAGDINKDGYDDIIIGAPGHNNRQGAAYIIYGGERSSMTNVLLPSSTAALFPSGFMITGNAGYFNFGYAVSSAGDVNNDGYYDILIGAYGSSSSLGAAYVIYGDDREVLSSLNLQSLVPPTTGFMISGNAVDDEFAKSLSGAGDINNDGYDDIIIGAHGKNTNQGAVYIIYGGQKSSMTNIFLYSQTLNPLTTGFMITGNAAGDYFGYSVSRAGDVNNDGYDDIIVGAHWRKTFQGAVYVIYGGAKSNMSNIQLSTTSLKPQTTGFMITGNLAYDYFGYSVSGAGDVNNDGYDDVIIGAYNKTNGLGAVYVVYGRQKSSLQNIDLSTRDLDPLTTGFSILGAVSGARVGVSVSACKINKDDYSDLIIGAPGGTSDKGTAYFIFYPICSANCKTCSFPSQCKTCFQGYAVSNSVCEECPTNCESCSIPTFCDVCNSTYLLYSGKCLTTCPSATFTPDLLKCQDCPAGCSACTSLSTCQACFDGYTLSESQCMKNRNSEKVAAGVFEGTSLAGAALGSGSSLPLNFGLVAKIIRNFKYMKLPVSQELYETFVSWRVASGFMSAPGSWSSKYNSKTIPTVFDRYSLQSAFMINFWKPLVMSMIGMAVFAIFKAIEVSMSKDKKSMVYTISRQVNVAASNFALTQFYSNLDDVVFYFILEMRSTEFETGFRVGSSILAVVLLLIGTIFVIRHLRLIAKYQKVKETGSPMQVKSFEAKCENISLIFKDFKDTNSVVQSFLMINVIRCVISNIIFALLFEYPMIQISFLFVLNILMIVYLLTKKSFKEFTNTCGQLFCEFILFIANICVFLLALFDHAGSYPISAIKGLGKCIIILNWILLFGCAILLLVNLLKMLYQSYLERRKPQQASLSTDKIFNSAKFSRPDSGLNQLNQSVSTTNDLINQPQSDSYQNRVSEDYQKLERYPTVVHQQGNSNNYSIEENQERLESSYQQGNSKSHSVRKRKQNSKKGFEESNSNVVLKSNQTNDLGEGTSRPGLFSNVLPRSRLVRNREMTKARIAQFSGVESPEDRIQDPSFHSRMGLNQDLSMTSFDIETNSPPQRGDDLRRRRGKT